MDEYDALMAEGERFRVELYQPDQAIEKYRRALSIGGPQDHQIMQMMGVCYRLKHECHEAIAWFDRALEGASDYEVGNILRDKAEALSELGEYGPATLLLADSLEKLPYTEYPSEHAASLGFLARTELRMDATDTAIKHFAVADAILSHEGNRHIELYTKLHYTNALSCAGRWLQARLMALRSFKLSLKYGARAHQVRAIVLLIGGYRADNWLRKHRQASA